MKLKVVVVDLEIPPRMKKWGLRLGMPVAVLLGAGGIAYATGLVTWSSGQTLQASDLNNNFSYIQGELAALQGQVHAASAFSAGLTSSTSIPNNSATTVLFDTVEFDLASEYNSSTGVFTPLQTGVYLVTCTISFPSIAASVSSVYIGVNAQNALVADSPMVATSSSVAEGTVIVHLTAGDSVKCEAYQDTGSTQPLYICGGTGCRDKFGATRLY